jgi:hypothetical protein
MAFAYDHSQAFVYRLRRRLGDVCTREQCTWSALTLWESKQAQWRAFDEHALQLSKDFPNLPEDVAEHYRRMFDSLDDPNQQ